MAPRVILRKNHKINTHNNIILKKLNRSTIVITQLRRKNAQLINQNKELSTTRNNLLLHKLSLENEIKSVTNTNIQLTAIQRTMSVKLGVLEQTLQKCVPALVTMSQYIPSMLENVHEMSKFGKLEELKNKEKKERQTKSVMPMINGMTIIQPNIKLNRCDMSPIQESPNTEKTPIQKKKSSISSPNLEPYVRLKDVAVMLKNSKSVSNETTPKRQINENLGEGTSWSYKENETQNLENNTTNITEVPNNSLIFNDTPMSTNNETSNVSDVQTDISVTSSDTNNRTSHTFNETGMRQSEAMSSVELSMIKNITCRKRQKRSSSNSSVMSDIDISITSTRSRRCATPNVNYKDNLKVKLRRNK